MAVTLTVLGSGDAFNAAGRGHASYLVDDLHGAFCVDFGPTAMGTLKRLGRDPKDLDGVFITHLHGDHYAGLQTFLVDAYYCSFRTRPFTIAGPIGTTERVKQLFALSYKTIAARPTPFPFHVVEYAPGQRVELLGRTVGVFQAEHQTPPDEVACILRIETCGKTLVFSGDTGWTEELIASSRGADLLVVECTSFDTPVPQHLAWKELGPQVPRIPAQRVLLTHLSEEMRAHADEAKIPGRVDVADDGMRLEF